MNLKEMKSKYKANVIHKESKAIYKKEKKKIIQKLHKLKEKNRIISVTQKLNKLRNFKTTTTHVSTTMRTYLRCFGTKYSPLNGITQTEVALADKGLKNQNKKN